MHMLQKVCEQLVIMGVVKKSLHTRQRNAESSGASADNGVGSQSVLSVTDMMQHSRDRHGHQAVNLIVKEQPRARKTQE
jgi:hypothetical protein